MKQDDVRERLNEFIAVTGIKAKHIAREVMGMHESVFSLFRHGKADLDALQIQKIIEYLKAKS